MASAKFTAAGGKAVEVAVVVANYFKGSGTPLKTAFVADYAVGMLKAAAPGATVNACGGVRQHQGCVHHPGAGPLHHRPRPGAALRGGT